jgi:2'-5' RNA ligase
MEKLKTRILGVKWTPPQNLHLTLAFLGDVETAKLASLSTVVHSVASGLAPFAVVWRGLGCFPTPVRPRIVWLGVDRGGDELTNVHLSLCEALEKAGWRPDRKFTPHATLARATPRGRGPGDLSGLAAEYSDWTAGESTTTEIHLMASEITSRGPVYSALARLRMGEV